ncbi:restriction endonuclease subunit S [Pseudomonas shirazica]|uniref:restriction endonuclease subunit S n=1 Tax=Pseudomonas shirazica TaxID=1940636 RepID=UPI0035232DCD
MSSEVVVGRFSIGDLIKAGAITAHKDGNFGSLYPRIDDFVDDGIPLLTAKVVSAGRIDFVAAQRLSQEKANKLPYGFIRAGDVLLSHNATVGRVAVVPEFSGQAMIGTSLTYFRVDRSRLLPRYLACFFESRDFQNQLASVMGLSTRNQVPITAQRLLEVEVPSLTVQRQLSEFVGAVDDRITLLRETNATLEAIAQALFKSWFVDFDPVRAKAEGRQPEGMDATTAALFPDSFEESELGLVPKGWAIVKFGDFINRLSVGQKYDQKTASPEGNVPVLDQGKSGIIGYHNDSPGVKASLEAPVVVFANHTCYMRLITFDFSAIQNVLPFNGLGVDTVWAFYATKGRIKFSEYKGHWPDFTIEKSVLPPAVLTHAFRDVVDPVMRKIRFNELQAQTLTQLRDTLLPRLISGQLRLPEVESLAREALS